MEYSEVIDTINAILICLRKRKLLRLGHVQASLPATLAFGSFGTRHSPMKKRSTLWTPWKHSASRMPQHL